MAEHDLIVLGGGCAGLSLGLQLAEAPGEVRSALILEAREVYTDDRTWCFWRTGPHRHEDLVSREWPSFKVIQQGRQLQLSCADAPYQQIASGDFYAFAQDRLAASRQVHLELGAAAVGDPRREGGSWVIRTGDRTLRAREVIDTRPPKSAPGCLLWQSFLGQVVRTDGASFDPRSVILMDLDEPSSEGVRFTYVLPHTESEALVETTVFSTRPHSPEELRADHDRDLQRRLDGAGFQVLREEHGVLPMGQTSTSEATPWTRAGLFHGAARPSTGYAFQRIQRWADHCADSLRRGHGPLAPAADPALRRWMDSVFLNVLVSAPDAGPELLFRLFSGAATERVVRFLSDAGSSADSLAIMRSLPKLPFLRQAGAQMLGLSRSIRA